MNKLCIVILATSCLGLSAFAAKPTPVDPFDSVPDASPMAPAQVSLADPIQLPNSGYDIEGFRLNFLYGASRSLTGLDLGLVGLTHEDMIGVAIQGFNWVEKNQIGLQLGAIGNVVSLDAMGLQIGGILNYDIGSFTGLQTSLLNMNGIFYGLQIAGVNWNKNISSGLQIGIVNRNISEFYGWSIALLNMANATSGLQVGVVNTAESVTGGVQLGVFNATSQMSGIQIGVLNLIGDAAVPVLPVVNGNF